MRRWAEITSFVVGAFAAAALLVEWHVPRGRSGLGADVRVSVVQSSALRLSQTGIVLDESHFRAGDRSAAGVTVSNPRHHRVRLTVRSDPGTDPVLDRLLRVELRAGKERVFRGALARLAARGAAPLSVPAGGSVRLTVAVAMPRDADQAYAGRSTQAALLFEERP
jgi:hypothetical protein